jgi:hypothetical protein
MRSGKVKSPEGATDPSPGRSPGNEERQVPRAPKGRQTLAQGEALGMRSDKVKSPEGAKWGSRTAFSSQPSAIRRRLKWIRLIADRRTLSA